LHDEKKDVRKNAAWGLGAIGDPRAVEALTDALKDPDPDVQRTAKKALETIEKKNTAPG
jgi:HEAT repeat protein